MPLIKSCIHLTEPRRKRRLASTRIQMRNIPKTAHAEGCDAGAGALLYRAPSPTTAPHRFRARAASERYLRDGKAGRTRRQNDRIKQSCPHSVPRPVKQSISHISVPSEQPVKRSIHPVVLFFYMGVLKDFCFMPVILIKILRLRHPRIRQPVPDTVPGILSRDGTACGANSRSQLQVSAVRQAFFKVRDAVSFARPSGDT